MYLEAWADYLLETSGDPTRSPGTISCWTWAVGVETVGELEPETVGDS